MCVCVCARAWVCERDWLLRVQIRNVDKPRADRKNVVRFKITRMHRRSSALYVKSKWGTHVCVFLINLKWIVPCDQLQEFSYKCYNPYFGNVVNIDPLQCIRAVPQISCTPYSTMHMPRSLELVWLMVGMKVISKGARDDEGIDVFLIWDRVRPGILPEPCQTLQGLRRNACPIYARQCVLGE